MTPTFSHTSSRAANGDFITIDIFWNETDDLFYVANHSINHPEREVFCLDTNDPKLAAHKFHYLVAYTEGIVKATYPKLRLCTW